MGFILSGAFITIWVITDHFDVSPGTCESCQSRLGACPVESGLKHILDPTILAHFQSIQRFALKHMMIAQFFYHLVDNSTAREWLVTNDATKRRLFMQYAGSAPGLGVKYVARREADGVLGTGCFAKAALHAIPFEKI